MNLTTKKSQVNLKGVWALASP